MPLHGVQGLPTFGVTLVYKRRQAAERGRDPKTRHDSNGLRPKKTARWGDVHKAVHYQRRILPGGRLREERVADLPDKDHKIAYKFIIEQSSVQARRSGKGP